MSDPAGVVTESSVRVEVRAWITENWDPRLSLRAWRELLVDSGWGAPSWERRCHGRALPRWADRIVASELAAADAVGMPVGAGMGLAAPTIHAHGPDQLRERFLRPTLTGEYTWCQLFSEPGAGSDLAGVTTHAVLDGDHWVVNGQKVWNTSAHHADFGILVARTNWDVPKHRGMTYFILPMREPGVEVRPLKQMNEYSSFNEVFMSDAVIPIDSVVGDVGSGWAVAMTTLAFERNFGGVARPRASSGAGLAWSEAQRESDEYYATYSWYPQRAGRVDLVVEHARQRDVADDPLVRQEVADLLAVQRVSQWTAERGAATRALGRTPGAEGSLGEVVAEQSCQTGIPRALADRRRDGNAQRAAGPVRRPHRRGPRLRSRPVDRRRHRRDPAQHSRGEDPRSGERTVGRQGYPVPRRPPKRLSVGEPVTRESRRR